MSTLIEARPALELDAVHDLLARDYGVVGELTELHSERDRNFLVETATGARSIFKIHNPAEPLAAVEMQTAALTHIARVDPDLPVGTTIPTTDGRPWIDVTGADGRTSLARMLSFLEGRHAERDDLDEAALFAWGQTAARLGRALRGFFHPEAGWHTPWDVRRFPGLRAWVPALDDETRPAVEMLLDRFDARVSAALVGMRAQVVHNDLSRGNLLVDDAHRVCGITDFGDMTHTALICDVAITIADVLDGRDGSIDLVPAMLAGYHSVVPLETDELAVLPDLVAARCAAALTITAWRDREAMAPPMIGAGARVLLGALLDAGLDDLSGRFVEAVRTRGRLPYAGRPTEDLLAARRRSLGPLSLTYRTPLHVRRGDGAYLYGASGERWLDAYNNVPVLGHAHPAVAEATAAQLSLLNTNSRYLHEAGVALAEELLASMPGAGLDRVLLVNSGSEANDLAWRIARFHTGVDGGVVTSYAYHGVTTVTTDLSPEAWGSMPRPSTIGLVDPPGSGMPVDDAIAALHQQGHGFAAMFVDGVFTSDGILGPAPDWTAAALDAAHDAGGLYVADEVQAGYGRTGDGLWSWMADRLTPDLVTLGKPMGNGYPVAAVIGRSAVIDPFMASTDYFSTYGGGTVACVAALAVLHAIGAEGIVTNARTTGAHLLGSLTELVGRYDAIAACRGWGLAIGVDIVGDEGQADAALTSSIVNAMRDAGVLIGTTGPLDSTLKIRPPLVIQPADCDLLVDTLDQVLSAGS